MNESVGKAKWKKKIEQLITNVELNIYIYLVKDKKIMENATHLVVGSFISNM